MKWKVAIALVSLPVVLAGCSNAFKEASEAEQALCSAKDHKNAVAFIDNLSDGSLRPSWTETIGYIHAGDGCLAAVEIAGDYTFRELTEADFDAAEELCRERGDPVDRCAIPDARRDELRDEIGPYPWLRKASLLRQGTELGWDSLDAKHVQRTLGIFRGNLENELAYQSENPDSWRGEEDLQYIRSDIEVVAAIAALKGLPEGCAALGELQSVNYRRQQDSEDPAIVYRYDGAANFEQKRVMLDALFAELETSGACG